MASDKRERVLYKQYKMNRKVLCKRTKQLYIVTGRDHNQRTVKLQLYVKIKIDLSTPKKLLQPMWIWDSLGGHSYGWKTVRQMRRDYILIEKAAEVLYGENL